LRTHVTTRRLGVATSVAALLAVGLAGPASAAPTSFTPGDLVIYQVGGTDSTSYAVTLVDYAVTGITSASPSGFSVTFPTTPGTPGSGLNQALVESGSATYDGELTLSTDGHHLIATGYDDSTGVTKLTSAFPVPRTIGVVDSAGDIDTTTALTDANSEGTAKTPNNFRSAASNDGKEFWAGGDGGVEYTTDGASTATQLAAATIHQTGLVGGQLYATTTGTGLPIVTVGTGEPTTAGQTLSALPGVAADGLSTKTTSYAFVTLGTGPGPDTIYIADTTSNVVDKLSLVSGSWVEKGSVPIVDPTGLVAEPSPTGGGENVYVTGAPVGSANTFNTVLYGLTDTSGAGGTLSATPTSMATSPTGTTWKGIAFAPTPASTSVLPEAPWSALLPVGGVLVAGVVIWRRRRTIIA